MRRAEPFNVLWLQAGGCGGCTMSVLERGASGWFEELRGFGVNLLWHPSVSEETGAEARAILAHVERGDLALDALCIEGSVLHGPDGSGLFNRLAGTGRSMLDWIRALAPRARYCVAVGTCAAFGGIPAAAPDPTDARGLQYLGGDPGGALGADYVSRSGLPVINVSGCAPHPGWIMETLLALSLGVSAAPIWTPRAAASFRRPSRPSRLQPQRILRVQGQRRELLRARLPDGASRLQGDAGGRRLQPALLERRRLLHPGRLDLHRLHLAGFRERRAAFSRRPRSPAFRSACRSTCPRPGSWRSPRCRNRRRQSACARMHARIASNCRRPRREEAKMSRIVIGPFNRVEGDLEVTLDIEDGIVRQATCRRRSIAASSKS